MKWWNGLKKNTRPLRWFGHTEKMDSEEFVKKVYVSEIEGPNRKRRPLGRWSERGATRARRFEQSRKECLDRERWRLFCRGHPLGERSRRERCVKAIDDRDRIFKLFFLLIIN